MSDQTTKPTAEPTQEELTKFVNSEVITCQSSLVDELLSKDVFSYDQIDNLYVYECPECGQKQGECFDSQAKDENAFDTEHTYKCYECGKEFETEPEQSTEEVLEWWLCTDWFTDKLRARGEPILSTVHGDWWGRTCSGQAIMMDGVIADIYKALQK